MFTILYLVYIITVFDRLKFTILTNHLAFFKLCYNFDQNKNHCRHLVAFFFDIISNLEYVWLCKQFFILGHIKMNKLLSKLTFEQWKSINLTALNIIKSLLRTIIYKPSGKWRIPNITNTEITFIFCSCTQHILNSKPLYVHIHVNEFKSATSTW